MKSEANSFGELPDDPAPLPPDDAAFLAPLPIYPRLLMLMNRHGRLSGRAPDQRTRTGYADQNSHRRLDVGLSEP